MAGDDNVLQAVLGALSGFESAYAPYQQAKFQDTLSRNRKRQDLQDELAVLPQKQAIETQGAVQKEQALLPTKMSLAQAEKPADYISGSDILSVSPMATAGGRAIDPKQKYNKALLPLLKDNSDKQNTEQDAMEEKARGRLSSIRGDASLAKIELQRDGAITAYQTLDKADKEGRPLSKVEYFDTLGQLWKARTGAAPTDQAIKDLDNSTFKGDIGKAFTYITGKTSGATTKEVAKSLKNFVKDTGFQMDKLHEGYMQTHLDMPTRLEKSRADHLRTLSRGTSFRDATGASEEQVDNGNNTTQFKNSDEILNHYLGSR